MLAADHWPSFLRRGDRKSPRLTMVLSSDMDGAVTLLCNGREVMTGGVRQAIDRMMTLGLEASGRFHMHIAGRELDIKVRNKAERAAGISPVLAVRPLDKGGPA